MSAHASTADEQAPAPDAHAGGRLVVVGPADRWPLVAVVLALTLTYGHLAFTQSLTLDEPVLGRMGQRQLVENWVSGGRWGMALVSALLPWMVVPSVTTTLGVALTGFGVWLHARGVVALGPWPAAAVTAVGATLPGVALHLSFLTNAVGVGLGFVGCAVVAWSVPRPRTVVLPVAVTALVLGTYEAFGLVLVAMAAAQLVLEPRRSTALRWLTSLAAGAAAWLVVGWVLRRGLGLAASDYGSSMIDLAGLRSDVGGRSADGLANAYGFVLPGGAVFDAGQPWLLLTFGVLVVLAVLGTLALARRHGSGRLRVVGLAVLLAVPGIAGVVVDGLPLRSMLYLPSVLVGLTGIADRGLGRPGRAKGRAAVAAGAVVTALTVVASATVLNRGLVAADAALATDRYVAQRIDEERRLLLPGTTDAVPVYVTPVDRWPASSLGPGLEHLGLSLFSGEPWRATSFLQSQGVPVVRPDRPREDAARRAASSMPAYPAPGWAAAVDGVLVVRLK